MAKKKNRRPSLKEKLSPILALLSRLSIVALILISLALVVIGKFNSGLVTNVTSAVAGVITPVLSVLTSPVGSYRAARDGIHNATNIYDENKKLRDEVEKLKRLQSVAVALEAENQRLRDVLKLSPDADSRYMTARVVGDTSSAYTRSIILSITGKKKAIAGQVVTSSEGLIGRVGESTQNTARVTLISDLNSRVPVITEKTRERAILAGNNTPLPQLQYLSLDSNVRVGERVLTSGDGRYFPPGVPVGEIYRFAKGSVYIRPYVDLSRLDYVNILMAN